MLAVDILRRKRDGQRLSSAEIRAFVAGAVSGEWPDYQLSAMLMAALLRGLDDEETAQLTRAMVESGEKLDWSDLGLPAVDKHSTGGVGDKLSLILAPLVACCDVAVPMMSGRSLGHSGGTLDKLEAIPGFRTTLSQEEMLAAMRKLNCVLIGPSERIAPADRKLYHLRDVTATVESVPLITASILSKKIAEGINGLVMDVKCGRGAFMQTREQARTLARSLVRVGNLNGVRTRALITAMDVPLGRCVGNALEVAESVEVLRGEGPRDVRELSLELAAQMVQLGRGGELAKARAEVEAALTSGRGLETFREIVRTQHGDVRVLDDLSRLPRAKQTMTIRADRSGVVHGWNAFAIGRGCTILGAGRLRKEDVVDPAVGAVILVRPGDHVHAGDALLELHYNDERRLQSILPSLADACPITEAPPNSEPLILEEIQE
jgi:pyrimidine-nucleoside phosphorylase